MNNNNSGTIKKIVISGVLGVAITTTATMGNTYVSMAAENKTCKISENNNIADIEEVTEAFRYTDAYTDYFGGYHIVYLDEKEYVNNEYLIIYLTDVSTEMKEEYMELTGIPKADNILFKKCSYTCNELEAVAEEIGNTYSYKNLCNIEYCVGYGSMDIEGIGHSTEVPYNLYVEDIENKTFDELDEYNNQVYVYIKDSDYATTKNSLEENYDNKVKCLTQAQWDKEIKTGRPLSITFDVNEDGKSDLIDVQMILKGALGIIDFTYNKFIEADRNQDEKLTLADAQLALQRALRIFNIE